MAKGRPREAVAAGRRNAEARAAQERAARAEELLAGAVDLRRRLNMAGLGVWTLGLDDLIDALRPLTRTEGDQP